MPLFLEDIFNSREQFINDSDLTGDFIRFIRPINESEEKQYKKKISANKIKLMMIILKKKQINMII